MPEKTFTLAGAELDWPIGSAAGLTNHPDIEVVAQRVEHLASLGLSEVVAGSWTVGDARGGNGYIKNGEYWEYIGGNGHDEYVDLRVHAGYNAKALPGPGTDVGMERIGDLVELANAKGAELSLSLSPHGREPLQELLEIVELADIALSKGVLMVEVNLSCPNIEGRPVFYEDYKAMEKWHEHTTYHKPLINKFGQLALREKYGPLKAGLLGTRVHFDHLYPTNIGGRVASNTLGNQEPKLPNGEPAIRVNNGRAGMSGPALKQEGRESLAAIAALKRRWYQVISVLGVDSGEEVKYRLEHGADFVQLGSALYWPELLGCKTSQDVVEKIKQELVEASRA